MSEQTLARELARRAEAAHLAPLSLDDVRGRAVRIRRRRRTAVAGVAAAAVAAIAVSPALLGGEADRTAPDVVDAGPTVAPGASVLHDGVLSTPDGRRVRLDVDPATVEALGVLTDGRIVVAHHAGSSAGVVVYSAEGDRLVTGPVATADVVMSPDDDAAFWMEPSGAVQVLASGRPEPARLGVVEADPMTGALVDAGDCAGGSCRAYVGDGSWTRWQVAGGAAEDLGLPGGTRITGISPDGTRWAVQYADDADPQYGCAGVYDPEAARMVARSCETANLAFSPDGEHLLGGFFENNMAGEVAILDLDLDVVGTYDPGPEVVSRVAWADPSHLVAATAGLADSRWSLVRVGLDGSEVGVVEGPVPGRNPEIATEFLLSR